MIRFRVPGIEDLTCPAHRLRDCADKLCGAFTAAQTTQPLPVIDPCVYRRSLPGAWWCRSAGQP